MGLGRSWHPSVVDEPEQNHSLPEQPLEHEHLDPHLDN